MYSIVIFLATSSTSSHILRKPFLCVVYLFAKTILQAHIRCWRGLLQVADSEQERRKVEQEHCEIAIASTKVGKDVAELKMKLKSAINRSRWVILAHQAHVMIKWL